MKRLITVLLLLLLFTSLYSQTKTFRLGFSGTYPVFHDPAGYNGKLGAADWAGYRDLNLNLWQGWKMGDKQSEVLDSLASSNLDGYFQPDSIIWMGSGRISIHEAEDNSSIHFRYNNHHNSGSNYTETWSGENISGRKYIVNPSDAGIKRPVLSGVRENAEYSYSGVPGDPVHQYEFWRDSVTGLNNVNNYIYIKPRMRISTTDAFADPPKLVARIYVLNHDGDTIRYFDINTEAFRHDNINTYDGRYLEDFWDLQMRVRLDSLNIGRTASYIEWLNKDSCKVDFQVHWYGEIDLYIDYMKVMDEPAYNLFHPDVNKRIIYRNYIKRMMNNYTNSRQ